MEAGFATANAWVSPERAFVGRKRIVLRTARVRSRPLAVEETLEPSVWSSKMRLIQINIRRRLENGRQRTDVPLKLFSALDLISPAQRNNVRSIRTEELCEPRLRIFGPFPLSTPDCLQSPNCAGDTGAEIGLSVQWDSIQTDRSFPWGTLRRSDGIPVRAAYLLCGSHRRGNLQDRRRWLSLVSHRRWSAEARFRGSNRGSRLRSERRLRRDGRRGHPRQCLARRWCLQIDRRGSHLDACWT